MPGNHQERGSEPTRDEVVPMLGEARMVVPGIQSLFGFQLIAVFTEGFRSLAPFSDCSFSPRFSQPSSRSGSS